MLLHKQNEGIVDWQVSPGCLESCKSPGFNGFSLCLSYITLRWRDFRPHQFIQTLLGWCYSTHKKNPPDVPQRVSMVQVWIILQLLSVVSWLFSFNLHFWTNCSFDQLNPPDARQMDSGPRSGPMFTWHVVNHSGRTVQPTHLLYPRRTCDPPPDVSVGHIRSGEPGPAEPRTSGGISLWPGVRRRSGVQDWPRDQLDWGSPPSGREIP